MNAATAVLYDQRWNSSVTRSMRRWVARWVDGDEPEVGQGLGVEPGVEQMEDGVGDTADVLVDRHPVLDQGLVEGHIGRPRVAEAKEVPRRVDEGVQGVGLPLRRPTARGAG